MRELSGTLALGLALVALVPALTIPFVPPASPIAVVRTVAAEIAPWLIALAIVAVLLGLPSLGSGDATGRAALAVAGTVLVLAAIPLHRVPAAIRDADQRLEAAFGELPAASRPAFAPLTTLLGQRAPSVPVERDVEFVGEGGTLRLDRHAESGGARRPAIVAIHGGAWQGGDRGDSFTGNTEWSRILAGEGYVVYNVQYRFAPEHPHPAAVRDIRCALAHIRARADADGVDPERVVLIGRSAGAHLALLAGYRQAERPCGPTARVVGVVALYGPTDLLSAHAFPGDPDLIGGRAILEAYVGGTPADSRAAYLDAMPRTWIRTAVPTLLIHGGADATVYPRHSEDLAQRLADQGVPAAAIVLPWAGHGFDVVSVGIGSQIALSATLRFTAAVTAPR